MAMTPAAVAIDGHVHLREATHDADALRAAARNFARWAGTGSRTGVLMLAEATGEDAFARLSTHPLPFTRRATAEAESLWIDAGGWRLLVLAGRQVATREGIEVLVLATAQRPADGVALDVLLQRLDASGAVPVLPWGCGKWLGARRRCVESALRGAHGPRLLLGDNGNRPRAWPEPLLDSGRAVLSGTDPLPLPGQWRHVGRFGSLLDVVLSEARPAADLRRALRGGAPLRPFGPHGNAGRFVLDQVRLRLARPAPLRAAA